MKKVKLVDKKTLITSLSDFYDVYVKNPDIDSFSRDFVLDDSILTRALAISACMTVDVTDKSLPLFMRIKEINNFKKN